MVRSNPTVQDGQSVGTIPNPVVPITQNTTAAPSVPGADQVLAAALALMLVAQQLVGTIGDDDQGAAKKGKKNEKVKCYRCGFAGHVLSDCTVMICDYSEKVDHVSEVCPLLNAPKAQIVVYGNADRNSVV